MPRKCNICGELKKTTFNCSRCKRIICLNCYNFVHDLCYDCEIMEYNERYRTKIQRYENLRKIKEINIIRGIKII